MGELIVYQSLCHLSVIRPVQKVVPGKNLPLVFSSETTICDLYDKENINQHTCYKKKFPYQSVKE